MKQKEYEIPFDEKIIQDIYQNYSHQEFHKMLKNERLDRALGCMFGAFIGDALGAFLEFNNNINQGLLNQAMKMKGGGTYNLRAGQVTDDSELSFHLFYGLTHYDPKGSLDQQLNKLIASICLEYVKWKKSRPFDIGNTCRIGINKIQQYEGKLVGNTNLKVVLDEMYNEIYMLNSESQSNGSLMRITPLPFFLSLIPDSDSGDLLIEKQIKLLHPNKHNVAAGKIWAKMLKDIIQRKDDNQLKRIYSEALQNSKNNELSSWVDAVDTKQPMNGKVNIGWTKIAWSYGLRILKLISDGGIQSRRDDLYVAYMKEIIGRGGDTDTNASIVGGMLGAIIGFKNLPFNYLKPLMNLTYSVQQKKKNDRSQYYEPKYFFAQVYWFIQKIKDKEKSIFPKPKYIPNMLPPINSHNACAII